MSDSSLDILKVLAPTIVELAPESDRPILGEALHAQIENLEIDIRNIKEAAERADADKQTIEDYKRYQEALAKGIPQLAKGIIGAINAYKSGDPFAAIAASLEIGATMTATIGALISKAAGVTGSLVGSVLSVFAMIIKLFSKSKTLSIAEQLDLVISKHDAKNHISELQAAQTAMEGLINRFLVITPDDHTAEGMRASLGANDKISKILNAEQWLADSDTQKLDLWPSVLAAQCYAYIYWVLMLTRSMEKLATHRDVLEMTSYMVSFHPQQLAFLKAIKAAARNRGRLWAIKEEWMFMGTGETTKDLYTRTFVVSSENWTPIVQGGLKATSVEVVSVATRQMRSAGPSESTPMAVFALEHSVGTDSRKDWDRDPLTFFAHPFRLSLKKPHSDIPLYKHQITARYGTPTISRQTKRHLLLPPPSQGTALPDCYDLYAITGYSPGEIDLFTAKGDAIYHWRQGAATHSEQAETVLGLGGRTLVKPGYKVGRVRAVVPIPFRDEDQGVLSAEADQWPSKTQPLVLNAIYGACEVEKGKSVIEPPTANKDKDHLEILVSYKFRPYNPSNNQLVGGYIEAPWPYLSGITTDKRYLWVYRNRSIACVTHTEVQVALRNKSARPPWIEYEIPKGVNVGPPYPYTHVYQGTPVGLLDLAACDDGTLTAVLSQKEPALFRTGHIYSLTPKVDRQKRTLDMAKMKEDSQGLQVKHHGWETDQSLISRKVIKQPIFCWSLIEGIEAAFPVSVVPLWLKFLGRGKIEVLDIFNNKETSIPCEFIISGDHKEDFVCNTKSQILQPGQKAPISVTFDTPAQEVRYATLLVQTNGYVLASVPLTGYPDPGKQLDFNP